MVAVAGLGVEHTAEMGVGLVNMRLAQCWWMRLIRLRQQSQVQREQQEELQGQLTKAGKTGHP